MMWCWLVASSFNWVTRLIILCKTSLIEWPKKGHEIYWLVWWKEIGNFELCLFVCTVSVTFFYQMSKISHGVSFQIKWISVKDTIPTNNQCVLTNCMLIIHRIPLFIYYKYIGRLFIEISNKTNNCFILRPCILSYE